MRRSFALRLLCVFLLFSVAACGSKEDKVRKFYSRGQTLYEQEHYVKAALEFKNALQIDRKYAKADYMLGMINLKRGKFQAAFSRFKRTVDLDPENIGARLEMANLYISAGTLDRADEMLSYILNRQPENERALLMRGAVLLTQKGPKAAIRHLERLRQQGDKSEQLFVLLAHAYQRAKNVKKDEEILREGIGKNPGTIMLRLRLAERLAERLDKRGQPAEALSLLKKVVSLAPDKAKYKFILAGFYIEQKKNKEAEALLDQLIAASGDDQAQMRTKVARFLQTKGLDETAKAVLRRGIGKQPQDTLQRRALAAILLDEGEVDQALKTLNDNLKTGLDDSDAGIIATKVGLAGIYLRKGELAESGRLVGEVIKESPKNIDAHYLKGKLDILDGNYVGAVAEFRTTLYERPDNIAYHLNLVQAYLLNNETELALDALKNAAKTFPDAQEVQQRLVSLLSSRGDHSGALAIAEKLHKRYPDDLGAAAQLADLLVTSGKVGEAERLYQSLKKNDKTAPFAYLRLAQIYAFAGNRQRAEAEVRQGMKKYPAADQLLAMAVQLTGKDLSRALKLVSARLTDNEKDPIAHNLAGTIYARQKEAEKAMRHFKRAAILAPKWPKPLNNMAIYSLQMGDKKEAAAFLQKALALNPANRVAFNALGSLRERSGEFDKAISIYERALKKNPKLWDAANNLAFLLVETRGTKKDIDRAYSLAKKALELNPEAPAVLDTLGWVYYRQGRNKLALSHLRLAVNKLEKVPAIVRYHFGMALLKNGEKSEGRSQLQKALAEQKDFPGRHEAKAELQEIL